MDTFKDNAPDPQPSREPEECFVCYGGLVFVGHHELTEEGEEIEVIQALPCRRCSDAK